MIHKLNCKALSIAVGLLLAAGCEAAPVVFDFSGAFQSGSLLTGTVTIDTATGLATAVNAIIGSPASLSFGVIEAQGLAFSGVYQLQIGDGVPGSLPDLNIGLFVAGSNLVGYSGSAIFLGSNIYYSATSQDSVVSGSVSQQIPEPAPLQLLVAASLALMFSRLGVRHG